jgi:thiamine pyrophosphate-dependent acetolactate synthase large subunit-like protein
MKVETRSELRRTTMKELIRQYLNNGISRRDLMRGLGAAGLTASAAKTIIESITPSPAMAQPAGDGAVRQVTGTGGKLYIEQLKAAGTEFIFFNPSTGDAPIYDALVDMPEIQLIKGVQEGAVVAMADGYARVSGKIGVAQIANVGLPSGMTQLVNSWKDRIPVLLTVAAFSTEATGRDYPQDYDHQEPMVTPITKSFWVAQSTAGIADVTRRVLKFGTTPPAGPVFLSIPDDLLRATGTADIYDGRLFNVAMKIRPDHDDVEAIAKLLIEARNPLITAGDEITLCQAEAEVVELANLLGVPVTTLAGSLGNWSKPYPTRDAQFVGAFVPGGHFPGPVDIHFNVGSQLGEQRIPNAITISMRSDPTGLARSWPIDMPIVANIKLGLADIIAAIKSMATADRLKQIADGRSVRTRDYTAGMAKMRAEIVRNLDNGSSITMERLGIELESGLDKETIFVTDCESGRIMDSMMTFGGTDKTFVQRQYSWLGAGGSHGRTARPPQPPGGLRHGRRQRHVRRPATAMEPSALQCSHHQHCRQQPQLQQRAQPHLEFYRPAAVPRRQGYDVLQWQPRCGFR